MTKRPVCDTPGCGRPIPKGGEGHPEVCPTCLECLKLHGRSPRVDMDVIIVKCTERHTVESPNGPLTRVKLVPDGTFNTHHGGLDVFVPGIEDEKRYQVGKRFRLIPEPI